MAGSRTGSESLLLLVRLLEVAWWRVLRAVLLGAGALGCSVGLAAVSAWLIARASQMPPVLTLSVAVVAVRAFGVGRGLLRYAERLASHDVALRGMAALRANLYQALAASSSGPLDLKRGELLARVGPDVDEVGNLVVRVVVPSGVAALVSAGSVTLVAMWLPPAALALLGCLLLAAVLAPGLAYWAARSTEERAASARGEVAAHMLDLLSYSSELLVSGRFDAQVAALAAAERREGGAQDVGARIAGGAAALAVLAQSLAVIAALTFALVAVQLGTLDRVPVAVVVLTPIAVFEATNALPAAAVQWRRSQEAARRIAALLPAPSARPPAATGEVTWPAGAPALELREVGVGWPRPGGGCHAVAEPVSFQVKPGQAVAVVGSSGAGKTTLLMTAAGLVPPLAGTVVAHRPLFIAEDGHIFHTSVLENLRLARGEVTPAEAEAALAQVGLSPWLAELPGGLDTVLGANATTVSGGERRRLLVARALLAEAQVLLIDEPTEHLDQAGAEALLAALRDHARRTSRGLVIATHVHLAGQDWDQVVQITATSSPDRFAHIPELAM